LPKGLLGFFKGAVVSLMLRGRRKENKRQPPSEKSVPANSSDGNDKKKKRLDAIEKREERTAIFSA